MTAFPDDSLRPTDHRPVVARRRAATHDDAPWVVADVPIAVWRLDERADDQQATDRAAGFASRLAQRLVLTYTSHGEAVVAFDHDTHLHHAAQSTGRGYLAVTDPSTLTADLDQIERSVSLITVRWPRSHAPSATPGRSEGDIVDLLGTSRHVMADNATVVAAIRPANAAGPGPTFADHEDLVRRAATTAGLTHVLQIVAVGVSGGGDQFLYYATPAEAAQIAESANDPGKVVHIDLLVFAKAHRHG